MKPATCGMLHLYYKHANCPVHYLSYLFSVPSVMAKAAVDAYLLCDFCLTIVLQLNNITYVFFIFRLFRNKFTTNL